MSLYKFSYDAWKECSMKTVWIAILITSVSFPVAGQSSADAMILHDRPVPHGHLTANVDGTPAFASEKMASNAERDSASTIIQELLVRVAQLESAVNELKKS